MRLEVVGRLEMFRSVVLTAVPSFDGDLFVAYRAGPVVPFIVMYWACIFMFPGLFGWEVLLGNRARAGLVRKEEEEEHIVWDFRNLTQG